jgi:hypothetical protein
MGRRCTRGAVESPPFSLDTRCPLRVFAGLGGSRGVVTVDRAMRQEILNAEQ